MRDRFDVFLLGEIQIGKNIRMKRVLALFGICISIAALLIRFELRHFVSGDMDGSLIEWVTYFEKYGGLRALRLNFACYNPPYLYILCLISYIDFPATPFTYMYYIKAVSVLFDFIAAFLMFRIVYEMTESAEKSIFAYAAVLLCPTVFLNSAAWGQCDMIHTVFLLACFYEILRGRSACSLLFMGLAFAFKLQAIFFMPFLIICWLKRKVRLVDFTLIPITYVVMILPALIAGQKFSDIVGIYTDSYGFYSSLTLSYPNLFALIESNNVTPPHWGVHDLVHDCLARCTDGICVHEAVPDDSGNSAAACAVYDFDIAVLYAADA